MAETLLQFDGPVTDNDGASYVARVCGRLAEDGLWEGWVEFAPTKGGPVLRTPRETDQSDRSHLEYWATGLSLSYLEGALARARNTPLPNLRQRSVVAEPVYDRPAPSAAPRAPAAADPPPAPETVLNPFEAHGQGVLQQELSALDRSHLKNIIRAHGLQGSAHDLEGYDHATLVGMIVDGVQERTGGPRT